MSNLMEWWKKYLGVEDPDGDFLDQRSSKNFKLPDPIKENKDIRNLGVWRKGDFTKWAPTKRPLKGKKYRRNDY